MIFFTQKKFSNQKIKSGLKTNYPNVYISVISLIFEIYFSQLIFYKNYK